MTKSIGDQLIAMVDTQTSPGDPLCPLTRTVRDQAYEMAVAFDAGPEFIEFEKADYELYRLRLQIENHDLTLAMRCKQPDNVQASRAALMMEIRSAIVRLAMCREQLRHRVDKGAIK
jgi:hypothetical protein